MFWETEVVQVIILDLEVLAERDQDFFGLLEILGSGDVLLIEGESNWEIE